MDLDGDGIAESVVEIEQEQDRMAAIIHLKKIKVRGSALELAEASHESVKQLHMAGRMGTIQLLRSEGEVAKAEIAWIDAQLDFARANILSTTEPTTFDTDEDGLPDMVYQPIPVSKLLDQKVELHRKLLEQRQQGHKRVESLNEAGTVSAEEVRHAALEMYEAEIDWLNARMERRKMKSVDVR